MIGLAFIAGVFAGAFCGVVVMALLSLTRSDGLPPGDRRSERR